MFAFVLGIEAWKGIKRHFHLFEQGDKDGSENERRGRKLGLRQGFYTVEKIHTN
jgi:Na+-exporting ATPase